MSHVQMEGNDLLASIIAIHVRNALEDLHHGGACLTDDVMCQINQLTRRANLGGAQVPRRT